MKTQYEKFGIVSPILCCSEEVARAASACIEREIGFSKPTYLTKIRKRLKLHRSPNSYNRHLDWLPIQNLVTQAPLLEAVKQILGPDLIVWRTNIFYKFGTNYDSLPWHRDNYLNLLSDPDSQLSVQIALTPTTPDNCMEVIPESHVLSEDEIRTQLGMPISTRNEVAGNIRFSGEPPQSLPVVLNPGYGCAFHHSLIHRSSMSGGAETPRICLTVRFAGASNEVRKRGERVPCALVSGESPEGLNFIHDWREK